jgi:hypothetical protein
MNRVTTADAKSYSNIYFSEKDAEVELLVAAAEEFVAKFLNRDSLSDSELQLDPEAAAADSPGAEQLKPSIKLLVLEAFDESWQNRGIMVQGSIVQENPSWMRAAHLYRKNLGV